MSYNPNSSSIDNNFRNPLRGGYSTESDQIWHGRADGHLLTEELTQIRNLISNIPSGRDTIVAAYALVPRGTQANLPTGGEARGVVLTTAPDTTTSNVIIQTTPPRETAGHDVICFFGFFKRRSDLTPVDDIIWNSSITLSSSVLVDAVADRVSTLETTSATQTQDISNIRTQQLTDEGRIDTLETTTNNQATSITNLETKDTELEAKDTEIEGNVSTLQTNQTNLTSRVTAVETKNTEQDTSISNLESADTVINTTLTHLQNEIDHINTNSLSPLNQSKLNLLQKITIPITGFTSFNFRAGTSGEWLTENSFTQGAQRGEAQVRISSEILDTENPVVARIRHDRRMDGDLTAGHFLSAVGYNFITGQNQFGSFSEAQKATLINAGYISTNWNQNSLEVFWVTNTGSYPRRIVINNVTIDIPGNLTVRTQGQLSFIDFQAQDSEARAQGSGGNWLTAFGVSSGDTVHFNILSRDSNWVFATSQMGSRRDLRVTIGQDASSFGWSAMRATDYGLAVLGQMRDTAGRDQSALLESYGFLAIAIQKPTNVQGIIQLYDFVDSFTRVKKIFIGTHEFSFSGNENVTPIGRSGLGFVALRIPVGTDLSSIVDGATLNFNIQFPDDSYISESEYFYQDVPLISPVEIDGEWAITTLQLEPKDVVTLAYPQTLSILRTRRDVLELLKKRITRESVYEETKGILKAGDGIFLEDDDDTQSITINTTALNVTTFKLGDVYRLTQWKQIFATKVSPLSSDFFVYNFRADTNDNPYPAFVRISPEGNITQNRVNFPASFLRGQKTNDAGMAQILPLHSNPYGTPVIWTPARRGSSTQFFGLFPYRGYYGGSEGTGSLGSQTNYNRFFQSYHWFVIDNDFLEIGARKALWNYPWALEINGHYIHIPSTLPVQTTSDGENYFIRFEPLHDQRTDQSFTFSDRTENGARIFIALPTSPTHLQNYLGKGFRGVKYFPGTVGDINLREKYGIEWRAPIINGVTVNNPPKRLFIDNVGYPISPHGEPDAQGFILYLTEHLFETNLPVSGSTKQIDALLEDGSYIFATISQGWYERFGLTSSTQNVSFNVQRSSVTPGDTQWVGITFTPGTPTDIGVYRSNWENASYLKSGIISGKSTGTLTARPNRTYTKIVRSFTFFAVDAASDTLQTVVAGVAEQVGSSTTFGQTGVTAPRDITFGESKLWLIDDNTNKLYVFSSLESGGATPVNNLLLEFGIDEDQPRMIAYHEPNQKLYLIGSGRNFLIELNKTTSRGAQVGSVTSGFGFSLENITGGCTWDDDHLIVYDSTDHNAYLVSVADGTATLWSSVTRLGVPAEDVFSGFTNFNGDIYCIGQSTKRIYQLDKQRKIVRPITAQDNFGKGTTQTDFWGLEAISFSKTETVTVPSQPSLDLIADIAFISSQYIGLVMAPTDTKQVRAINIIQPTDNSLISKRTVFPRVSYTRISGSTRLYRISLPQDQRLDLTAGTPITIDLEFSDGTHATSIQEDDIYLPANWFFNSNDILKVLYQGKGNTRLFQIQEERVEIYDLGFELARASDLSPSASQVNNRLPMAPIRENQVALLEQKEGSLGAFVLSFTAGEETRGDAYTRSTRSSDFQYPNWASDDNWLFAQIRPGWLILVAKKNNLSTTYGILYKIGTDNSVERKNEMVLEIEDLKTENNRSLLSLTRISNDKLILLYNDNGNPTSTRQSVITITDFEKGLMRIDHGGILGSFPQGDTVTHSMIQRGVSNKYLQLIRPTDVHTLVAYEFTIDGLK